jgi:dimethylamine/trimethylamine dehydrogenase
VAAGLADMLSSRGKRVTVMTHLPVFAPYTHLTLESTFFGRKLHEQGVSLMTNTLPARCAPEGVWAHSVYATEAEAQLYPADAIVLVTQRSSDTGLYRALKDLGPEALAAEGVTGLFRIGDCVAPRIVAEAVFDGHRLAREIDSDDPAMPRPYLRERLVVSQSNVVA